MYLIKREKEVKIDNPTLINNFYNDGYLFGRKKSGYIYQTRALRVDLSKFSPNSENRRILRKFELNLQKLSLPILEKYDWRIHKMGKDFYSTKFPDEKFSASKIREMLVTEFHFNLLLKYLEGEKALGYAICYENEDILHYCFPFYDLELPTGVNNLGMYMMLRAILWAQMSGKSYVYLGGVTRPEDKYKLQFSGLEWYSLDDENWNNGLEELKGILQHF